MLVEIDGSWGEAGPSRIYRESVGTTVANLRRHLTDLPPELGRIDTPLEDSGETDWRELLCQWARNELVQGKHHILRQAIPAFERSMIEVALHHSQGRKRDAAELLGWGRNTLTRKMKELEM